MNDRREPLEPPVTASAQDAPVRLSSDEIAVLTQRIAELASNGFSLAAGLRAAAAEPVSASVAHAYRQLAERLERGESLAGLVTDPRSGLPAQVGGLIVLAIRSGRLGEALTEWVEAEKSSRQLQRGLREAMAYPTWIAAISALLVAGILGVVTPQFRKMFDEFDLILPSATQHVLWWHDYGLWLLLVGGAGAWGVASFLRRIRGPAAWARWMAAAPLFGTVWSARGWAEWFSSMQVLVKYSATLPDALRWSAAASSNAWIASLSREWATRAESGERLSEIVAGQAGFPAGAVPFLHWGESQATLAESLAASREFLHQRARLRTELLRLILPPTALALIGCCVLGICIAMFGPLVSLIQGLS